MSASDTDIETQIARHKSPLLGMGLIVGAVAILFLVFLAWTFSQAEDSAPAVSTPSIVIEE